MLAEVNSIREAKMEEVPCEILVDDKNFLPEWDAEKGTGCLGGFEIYANKNRTVCSQTLEARMQLVFAQATPQIRHMLFPSLRKVRKPKEWALSYELVYRWLYLPLYLHQNYQYY